MTARVVAVVLCDATTILLFLWIGWWTLLVAAGVAFVGGVARAARL